MRAVAEDEDAMMNSHFRSPQPTWWAFSAVFHAERKSHDDISSIKKVSGHYAFNNIKIIHIYAVSTIKHSQNLLADWQRQQKFFLPLSVSPLLPSIYQHAGFVRRMHHALATT